MVKLIFLILTLICFIPFSHVQAQFQTEILIQTTHEDENIGLSIDKPVYSPGDTIHLSIHREKSNSAIILTPVLPVKETSFTAIDDNSYIAVIPLNIIPGSYQIHLNVLDADGRRFIYITNCIVEIDENQTVENIKKYVLIKPRDGGEDIKTATTLNQKQVQNLKIVMMRNEIPEQMGPQFIIIKTTVISREGTTIQTKERRVMTFRSHGDPFSDRVAFNQYRSAYGNYAATRYDEIDEVQLNLDSLPDWATIKVSIEPDYIIKIGTHNQPNSLTRFFQVKGPTIEIGFFLGFPKVLYDTRADDTIDYGNTSAILRFYYVNSVTGHRFPVNLGIGTFGSNSPFNLGAGLGGFAISLFLDIATVLEQLNIYFPSQVSKVSIGLDVSPFIPIKRKWRVLVNAYLGYTF